jgi:hypothetical protein
MAKSDSTQDRRLTAGGHGRKGKRTPEYRSWQKMKQRCYSPSQYCYHLYGGRGITICERWLDSFVNFLEDMGQKPSPTHSIDRIDNNGHYEPGNCRWATPQEQMDNSRRSTMLTHKGETLSIRAWSRKLGVTHSGISYRLKQGWTIDRIVDHFRTYSGCDPPPRAIC